MKRIVTILCACIVALSLPAQTYQAENGNYQGAVNNGFVEIRNDGDYAQVSFSLSEQALYDIYVAYQSPHGDKEMTVTVNGVSGTLAIPTASSSTEIKYATMILPAGNNTIRVGAPWTWFDVDYIRIATAGSGGGNSGGGNTELPDHGFIVSGKQLLDAKNNPFVIRGTNLAYAWYKGYGYQNQIAQMRARGANAVRIVLSNGNEYYKDGASTVQQMIAYCEQQKMVAILEVHDATGSNETSALTAAVDYWKEMKSVLQGHEHTVIINIANEWLGDWNSNTWESAYKTAITTLRNEGIEHCIMIDADGYGQHAATIPQKGNSVLQADPDKNVIFSIHMYGTAGSPSSAQSNIQNVLNQNLCLCVGEFGWYHSDGDVDEDAIISKCAAEKVGWCAWSWWGNGSPVQYLDMVSDQNNGTPATQSYGNYSCAWGQKIYDAWKADSQLCTVYTDAPTMDMQLFDFEMEQLRPRKILRDGQVLIQIGDQLYNLQGVRIQ